MLLMLYRRLIVDGSPESSSERKQRQNWCVGGLLEKKDMWFWFMDFVMLPSQTLPDAMLVAARELDVLIWLYAPV